MLHPQSTAKKLKNLLSEGLEKNIDSIINYSCCAMVAMWTLHVEPDSDIEAIQIINDAIKAGVIEKDCTVHWAEFGSWLTGRDVSVEFVDIKDIFKIKDRTPVRFDYKGKSHWVGVEKGKIVFNSLDNSECVNRGRPVTMRVLHIKGVTK